MPMWGQSHYLTLIQECSRLWAMVILLLEEPPELVSCVSAAFTVLPTQQEGVVHALPAAALVLRADLWLTQGTSPGSPP